MKDYVKKIKQEDARIDLRKRTLARNAERIAQARAKAATAAAAPNVPIADTIAPPQPREGDLPMTEIKSESSPQPIPVAIASPVHPSLPPKPSSTTSIKPEPGPAPAASSTSSVPPPTRPPASTQESTPPVDEQVQKFEEVSSAMPWLLDSVFIFS